MKKKKRERSKILYSPDVWCSCGNIQLMNGNYEDAIKNFLQAISLEEKEYKKSKKKGKEHYIHPYFGCAIAYRHIKNFKIAEEYYKKCLEFNSNYVYAIRGLAELYTEQLQKFILMLEEKQKDFDEIKAEKNIDMRKEIMDEVKKYTSLSMEWLSKAKEMEEKLNTRKVMVDLTQIVKGIIQRNEKV